MYFQITSCTLSVVDQHFEYAQHLDMHSLHWSDFVCTCMRTDCKRRRKTRENYQGCQVCCHRFLRRRGTAILARVCVRCMHACVHFVIPMLECFYILCFHCVRALRAYLCLVLNLRNRTYLSRPCSKAQGHPQYICLCVALTVAHTRHDRSLKVTRMSLSNALHSRMAEGSTTPSLTLRSSRSTTSPSFPPSSFSETLRTRGCEMCMECVMIHI